MHSVLFVWIFYKSILHKTTHEHFNSSLFCFHMLHMLSSITCSPVISRQIFPLINVTIQSGSYDYCHDVLIAARATETPADVLHIYLVYLQNICNRIFIFQTNRFLTLDTNIFFLCVVFSDHFVLASCLSLFLLVMWMTHVASFLVMCVCLLLHSCLYKAECVL